MQNIGLKTVTCLSILTLSLAFACSREKLSVRVKSAAKVSLPYSSILPDAPLTISISGKIWRESSNLLLTASSGSILADANFHVLKLSPTEPHLQLLTSGTSSESGDFSFQIPNLSPKDVIQITAYEENQTQGVRIIPLSAYYEADDDSIAIKADVDLVQSTMSQCLVRTNVLLQRTNSVQLDKLQELVIKYISDLKLNTQRLSVPEIADALLKDTRFSNDLSNIFPPQSQNDASSTCVRWDAFKLPAFTQVFPTNAATLTNFNKTAPNTNGIYFLNPSLLDSTNLILRGANVTDELKHIFFELQQKTTSSASISYYDVTASVFSTVEQKNEISLGTTGDWTQELSPSKLSYGQSYDLVLMASNYCKETIYQATISWTWKSPPTASSSSSTFLQNTSNNVVTLNYTDADGDIASTCELVSQPAHGTASSCTCVAGVCSASYTPSTGYNGSDQLAFKVSDGIFSSSAATISITVDVIVPPNHAPVITTASCPNAAVGEFYQCNFAATDDDGDGLTWSIDADAIADGMTISVNSGRLSWTPASAGTFPVTVTVNDGKGGITSATFSINALDPNNPPVIVNTCPSTATVGVPYTCNLIAEDPDGDSIMWELDLGSQAVGVTLDMMGTLNWVPPIQCTQVITVTVTDIKGASSSWSVSIEASP